MKQRTKEEKRNLLVIRYVFKMIFLELYASPRTTDRMSQLAVDYIRLCESEITKDPLYVELLNDVAGVYGL